MIEPTEVIVPVDQTGSLPCKYCPDDNCAILGCVAPLPSWWLTAPSSCALVIDASSPISIAGTVYAQARECQNNYASSVIDIDDAWVIDVHISVTSPLPVTACGLWCVSACLEDMCGPNYYRFPLNSASPPSYCCCLVETNQWINEYEISICIPENVVQESECGAHMSSRQL